MSWNSWSYKKKNKALLIAAIAFIPVIYFLAIQKTFVLASENSNMKKQLVQLESAPARLKTMEEKSKLMNSRLSSYFSSSEKEEEHVLEAVSSFCSKHRLLLREFPEIEEVEEKDFVVASNQVQVEGDFINLLKLVHHLEKEGAAGRVSSVSYDSFFDNKRKKQVLVLTLYLQTLKIKKDVTN